MKVSRGSYAVPGGGTGGWSGRYRDKGKAWLRFEVKGGRMLSNLFHRRGELNEFKPLLQVYRGEVGMVKVIFL